MIDTIQKQVKSTNYRYTIHGFERCVEREISPNEIEGVILSGEMIENYTDDKYGVLALFMVRLGRVGYYMFIVQSILYGSLQLMIRP